MIKNIVSHGNSSALIIDKPILDLLKIDMSTPLEITTDGENLIISPVNGKEREKKIKSAIRKVNERHSKTLKRLAE